MCFATLLMMVIGFIQAADGLFGILYPPPAETPFYAKEPPAGMTMEQWQEQNRVSQEMQQQRERYYQVRRIVESLIMVVVALPIYWYHWRKIEKEGPATA
ncbi:MAG: hypothetical protein QHH02_01725 [Syntrophomonadaceae bacterium]|nr:hypothetical protein [Syntrophomonadaceae bacterium]